MLCLNLGNTFLMVFPGERPGYCPCAEIQHTTVVGDFPCPHPDLSILMSSVTNVGADLPGAGQVQHGLMLLWVTICSLSIFDWRRLKETVHVDSRHTVAHGALEALLEIATHRQEPVGQTKDRLVQLMHLLHIGILNDAPLLRGAEQIHFPIHAAGSLHRLGALLLLFLYTGHVFGLHPFLQVLSSAISLEICDGHMGTSLPEGSVVRGPRKPDDQRKLPLSATLAACRRFVDDDRVFRREAHLLSGLGPDIRFGKALQALGIGSLLVKEQVQQIEDAASLQHSL
mmetsp:Transcript_84860/g.141457  ORF Transcript_84860/g.141457 Transcript_84860/m.141457 type:complete len:285 (-) Transcript_84860:248-1102(-)